MIAPDPDVVRYLVWGGALLVAHRVFCSHTEKPRERLVVGLFAGVVLAHLGLGILYLPRMYESPGWLLQPGAASLLFVPLGVRLVAPWRGALAALPLALGIARLGCLPLRLLLRHDLERVAGAYRVCGAAPGGAALAFPDGAHRPLWLWRHPAALAPAAA